MENEDLRRQIDRLRMVANYRVRGHTTTLTPRQIHVEMIIISAQAGLSLEAALRKLDAGELDGTPLEVELEMRRLLLGEPARQKTHEAP